MIIRKTWFYKNLKVYLEVDILLPYHDKTPGSEIKQSKMHMKYNIPTLSSLHY